MAIKVVYQGVDFIVDTPDEAVELHKKLVRQRAGATAATSRWDREKARNGRPKHQKTDVSRVFMALSEADHGRLTYDALAKALGVKHAAIPPLFAHARRWQKRVAPGEPFERFIKKSEDPSGMTVFALTGEGQMLVGKAVGGD